MASDALLADLVCGCAQEAPAPGSVSAPLAGGGPLAGLNLSQLGAAGGLPGFPGSGGLANLANQAPLASTQGAANHVASLPGAPMCMLLADRFQ